MAIKIERILPTTPLLSYGTSLANLDVSIGCRGLSQHSSMVTSADSKWQAPGISGTHQRTR